MIHTDLRSDISGPPCLAKHFICVEVFGAQLRRKSPADWAGLRRSFASAGRRDFVFLRSSSLNACLVNQIFDKLSQKSGGELCRAGE
jgi:hypothetical protein